MFSKNSIIDFNWRYDSPKELERLSLTLPIKKHDFKRIIRAKT